MIKYLILFFLTNAIFQPIAQAIVCSDVFKNADQAFEYELTQDPHLMNKSRGLREYADESFAGAPFMQLLQDLPTNFLIVENGPGQGHAAVDILNDPTLGKSGRILLIDRNKPDDHSFDEAKHRFGDRLNFIAGESLEQRVANGSLQAYEGTADLTIGSFSSESYSVSFRESLAASLRLLKAGGHNVFNVAWMNISRTPRLNTTFRPGNDLDGADNTADETLRTWLRQIKGVEVEFVGTAGFNDFYWVIVMKRTNEPLELPPLQTVIYETNYAPPRRVFVAPTVIIP